jgi:GNAT superfamily N-acetyltransferase
MARHIEVTRETTLPSDLEEALLPKAIHEGFEALRWLVEDWANGENRFSEVGEALYTARIDGRLVGICGVNRDPYADAATVGRLRRLYVHPDFRRQGVGRRLVQRASDEARGYFRCIRLRTLDASSAAFFEAIGFLKVEGDQSCTHAIRFLDRFRMQDLLQLRS